jgi:hypothetical protein
MKKFLTAAICLTAIGSMSAQKQVVDQASKLSGKIEQIEEARGLLQQAFANPETANDARTYFVAGKLEFDAYDKNQAKYQVNPSDQSIDQVGMATQLLNGYNYFVQAFPLDQLPNAKGEIKPKYTKDIASKIAGHCPDFFNMGAILYGAQKFYPEAYNAFMIYGDMPEMEELGKLAPQVADTIRATSYFNAGLCAYSANKVPESAEAFRKARLNNYPGQDAYIYELACWQNIMAKDSTMSDTAKSKINDIALAGYNKFGMTQPVFLTNLVNNLMLDGQENEAIAMINKELENHDDMSSLYGLRAYVYDHCGKDAESEADYRKVVSMPNADFESLKNASRKLFLQGTAALNNVEFGGAEGRAKKQEIKTKYFEDAKTAAEKAKAINPTDSTLNAIIENIDYALENLLN